MSYFSLVYSNARWQLQQQPTRMPKAKQRALARARARQRRAQRKSSRQLRDLGHARYRLEVLALFRQKYGHSIFYPDTPDEILYIAELMNQERVYIAHRGHRLFWAHHKPARLSVTAEYLLFTAIANKLEKHNDSQSQTEAPDPQAPSGETAV